MKKFISWMLLAASVAAFAADATRSSRDTFEPRGLHLAARVSLSTVRRAASRR